MLELTSAHADRYQALERLRARGTNPYPHAYPGRRLGAVVRDGAAALQPGQVLVGPGERVAGRVVGIRRMGRIAFMDLRDRSGVLQVVLDERALGREAFAIALEHQPCDHVGATGHPMRTRSGEPSLRAVEITMLSKALIATSEGLRDPETRQRRREADLIANPESLEVFLARARVIVTVREFMHERGFVEVETPVLQHTVGGAEARPFTTHHNALNVPMSLRIAPELFLKRCVVGGLERVYEIGKNFRNEGISTKHNPEFTVIEWYETYADYDDLMREVEELVHRVALAAGHPDPGRFTPPWRCVRLHEEIHALTGIDILAHPTAAELRSAMDDAGIPTDASQSWGALVDFLQAKFVEPTFARPTFLIDHPAAMSPLAKTHREDPRLTERFEAFIDGLEVANAFTELNDPVEQRARFLASATEGDRAHALDEDFLEALARGMPPTAGCGIGLDRLVMPGSAPTSATGARGSRSTDAWWWWNERSRRWRASRPTTSSNRVSRQSWHG